MHSTEKSKDQVKNNIKQHSPKPDAEDLTHLHQSVHSSQAIEQVKQNPQLLNRTDLLQLQRTIGNRAVAQLLAQTTIPQADTQSTTGVPVIQRTKDDDGESIGGRVAARGKFNKLTSRQQAMHLKKGKYKNDGRGREQKQAEKRKKRAEAQGNAREEVYKKNRKLWSDKARPSRPTFTNETVDAVFGKAHQITREDGVTTYQCVDGEYYPKLTDRVGDEPYATIDHKKNWEEFIRDNAAPEPDGEITSKSARDAYNREDNLQLMSSSANSSKSGPKNKFH